MIIPLQINKKTNVLKRNRHEYKNSSRFTPVIIAVSVVVGILIGTFYAKHFAGNRLGIINGSSNKLNALLRIVDDQYVDTVNILIW